MPKERQAFRRNVMTTIYRGVKVTLPSRTEKAPRSGVYRGVKWSRDEETQKEVPSMKRGTYRGVDWVA